MSLISQIEEIWSTSNFPSPQIPLLNHAGRYYITIDDSTNFLRFMNSNGQIFIALRQKCQLQDFYDSNTGDTYTLYVCDKLTPILCSPVAGNNYDIDSFVLSNLAPLLND